MNENDEMMMEETNPAEDVELESTEDEFVLELEEDTAENAEETETEENEEQATPAEDMFPGEFDVDGTTRQLTMTEANSFIHKGLLYGQLKEKYMGKLKDAYSDPRIAFVDELAKAAGVDASEYMANSRMKNEYSSLIETYGDLGSVPEAVMKMFTENTQANKEKIAKSLEAMQQQKWEQDKQEEFEAFRENHPEIKEIPKEVVELVSKGESLEGAWAIVSLSKTLEKVSQLEKENKILTQNNKNKQTKLPSAQSSAVKEDDLVWEFN